MKQVTFVFVGGFLGAGKTTLLSQAARRLADSGLRVGIITNDQADDLVDTGFLTHGGAAVREIAGGCFCCRFDDLVDSAERLLDELNPDILLAEPVGSCTDISATVLQPMKELYGNWFRVAPFTVLTDPARLREALLPAAGRSLPDNVMYIFEKQLEEADLIVLNKCDTLEPSELDTLLKGVSERFPGPRVITMAALTGDGVDAWLDAIRKGGVAGERVVPVDYDRYADGEAVLGWLNATAELSGRTPFEAAGFAAELLEAIQDRCRSQDAEIAHVKLLLNAPECSITGNVTSNTSPISVQGDDADIDRAALILNARVHTTPEALEATVRAALADVCDNSLNVELAHVQSLSPGRPEPVHRYDKPV